MQKEFSDGITISGEYNPLYSRYHYNSVENGILEYLAQYPVPFITAVLDVGPGAGHWIDFYRDVVRASEIVGVEIAPTAVRALRDKYDGVREVVIKEGDVSEVGFSLDKEFDIVNAIGVMFHITDDPKWQAAVGNLARHLSPSGVIIVGGQFGHITRDVQFHSNDDFSSWEGLHDAGQDIVLVNKRIRSLRKWKRCAASAGLVVDRLIKTRQHSTIRTPENNVLVLKRARS